VFFQVLDEADRMLSADFEGEVGPGAAVL